jgi:hypothetical protein
MALTRGSFFETDTTGGPETLNLVSVPLQPATQARIATAVYGGDAGNVTIAADGLSLTLTKILAGTNMLVVTVVSPSIKDTANLVQGATVFHTFTLTEHWDSGTLRINGK